MPSDRNCMLCLQKLSRTFFKILKITYFYKIIICNLVSKNETIMRLFISIRKIRLINVSFENSGIYFLTKRLIPFTFLKTQDSKAKIPFFVVTNSCH